MQGKGLVVRVPEDKVLADKVPEDMVLEDKVPEDRVQVTLLEMWMWVSRKSQQMWVGTRDVFTLTQKCIKLHES